MLKRAMDERGRIRCEGCGMDVTGKAVEFDHKVPEAMLLAVDKAKPLTIEDGQMLGRDCCHRALGIKWTGHQAFMIADSIHFYGCTNVPDDLPIFVDRLGDGEPPGKRDE